MLEEGTISTRGLKKDADVFAEMVFDVNTLYFDKHGGYEYAKDFFTETYRMAVKEAGGEYVLSAVMHSFFYSTENSEGRVYQSRLFSSAISTQVSHPV